MLPNNRKSFSARRLVLLASVAAVGAALLVGGSRLSRRALPAWTAAASAADSAMQHPSGFADIVSKVKPAVISVRVKIPASAEPAMMQQQGDDDQDAIPTVPGSPMDKFFRQFGDQFGRVRAAKEANKASAARRRKAIRPSPAKAPASSSPPTAMR